MNAAPRLNWVNTLFLIITPLIGVIGTVWLAIDGAIYWQTVVLAAVLAIAAGLSICAGYHRLFSHRSYRTVWPVRLFFLLISTAIFEGSALEWSTDHRQHHRHTDTDKDPYDISKGFWFAHIGWLFYLDPSKRDFSNVEDLLADPLVRFQHRFFVPLAIFMGFILPLGIAALWGDMLGGFIIAGALRVTFGQHTTFCINSICHLWGKRTYSEEQSARDNWVTALFTFGEGFHNFHHKFALDYRNGVRLYDWDPGKWLIFSLSRLGLAFDLKRVTKEQIIRYRIQADENLIFAQAKHYLEASKQIVQPLRDRILQAAVYLEQLEKDYQGLKQRKMDYMHGKMAEYRAHLHEQKQRLKKARMDLRKSMSQWADLVRNPSKLSLES